MTTSQQHLSFDLHEGMLKMLGKEFAPQDAVNSFAAAVSGKGGDAVDKAAREVFGDYGRKLIQRTMQLGEEFTDRTYETLKEIIDRTHTLYFPLVPQRFLEIAYLSTQPIYEFPIVQNNGEKLVYKMTECGTFTALKQSCGEAVANSMPCRHACLSALETLFRRLDIPATIKMEASFARDGHCQFAAIKI